MGLRQHYLFVCTNRRDESDPRGSCACRGSEEIHAALNNRLKESGLAATTARVCAASCLDQCASGVTILVEPDHFFYGRVTLADVPQIAEALGRGERVERLVLQPADLERR